ncbi:MAG: hypothetical protein AB8G96_02295 [Phycisphaerales bacterium]
MPSTITPLPSGPTVDPRPAVSPAATSAPSIMRFESGVQGVLPIRPRRAEPSDSVDAAAVVSATTDRATTDLDTTDPTACCPARTAPCPRNVQPGDVWCPTCDGLMSGCHTMRLRGG